MMALPAKWEQCARMAAGEKVDGVVPTMRQRLSACKLILDRVLPQAAEETDNYFPPVAADAVSYGWRTPDTYLSCAFSNIPESPGVYVLEGFRDDEVGQKPLGALYVGKSLWLNRRLYSHPVRNELNRENIWTRRWFKTLRADQISASERALIALLNPPYNIIGKRRGLAACA